MSSLLAHLFTRIQGSPENVAVLSLHYLLTNSPEACSAFIRYLSEVTQVPLSPDLWFKTEATGESLERPDLVAHNREGQEVLVCEAKFWAGLTANQPQGYLKRIAQAGNQHSGALVFICPHKRITSLWHELVRSSELEPIPKVEFEDYRRDVVHDIPLAVVSWRSLLQTMGEALTKSHSPLAADLLQLRGLCEAMDTQAFIPFNADDLSVSQARRISSYYHIVDLVGDRLISDHNATVDGLRSTYHYAGYVRYMHWHQYGIGVVFNCRYWQNLAETPYWLLVRERAHQSWTFARSARVALHHLENTIPQRMFLEGDSSSTRLLFPLYAPCHVSDSEVVHTLLLSALEVLHRLPEM